MVGWPLDISHVATAPLMGLTVASAYSGCGGMDIGFRVAGFECVWANDIDSVAAETYEAALGGHVFAGDIERVLWPASGSADVVIGGPPCQGFSVAGKMNPSDPRSRHVDRFFDLVAHVCPRAFVMENVKALAMSARWSVVREHLLARAEELGYRTSLLVLNAADFAVPQRRERMFLFGLRDAAPPTAVVPISSRHVTVRNALKHLPPFGEAGNSTRCTAGITPARRPVLRPSPYKGSLLFNGNGRPLCLDGTAGTLPASMGGNATPIVDQNELETGEESWVVQYHRRLMNGGKPLKRVPKHLRRVTVEEAAQLQGFPIGMTFRGSTSARYRQIGNAVPPPLAYAVAQALARTLKATNPLRAEPLAA